MTRHKSRFAGSTRDAGPFVALPWSVLDSPAYLGLSAHAKALLIELARQLTGNNNGVLLCSRAKLEPRGWNSNDMLTKARRELVEAGLLFQTAMGQRPNKASWYAVTWQSLDRIDGMDAGAAQLFRRGAYKTLLPMAKGARGASQQRVVPFKKTRPLDRPTVQEARA